MTQEQKQKLKDYRREYFKKYYAARNLNNKTIDDKIIEDDEIIDDDETIDEIIDEIIDSEIIDDDSSEDNGYDSDNENDF